MSNINKYKSIKLKEVLIINGSNKPSKTDKLRLRFIPNHFPKYSCFLLIGLVNIDFIKEIESIKDKEENNKANKGIKNKTIFNKETIDLEGLLEDICNIIKDKKNKIPVKKYNHPFLTLSKNSSLLIFTIIVYSSLL